MNISSLWIIFLFERDSRTIQLSGHGFKMAPVVGKILSQMALGEKVLYDVLPFRLSRFIGSSGRKSSL